MNDIWAPWRGEYVGSPKADGCIFCSAPQHDDPLIITADEHCYAIMNRFPYTAGHCMVVPFRHVSDLSDLTGEEAASLTRLTQMLVKAIRSTMTPDGFNVGCNIGAAAGAGYADHLHMHIVPRWNGDTNFMPVIGKVHTISEHIESTRSKIRQALNGNGS